MIQERKSKLLSEGDNMIIEGDTIVFKSDHDNFIKERDGIKPNTVRRFTTSDELKAIEQFWDWWWSDGKQKKIKIIDQLSLSFLPVNSFTRELTDITEYDGLWIFSWKHKDD